MIFSSPLDLIVVLLNISDPAAGFGGRPHPESPACFIRSPVQYLSGAIAVGHVTCCLCLFASVKMVWTACYALPSSNPLLELFILLYCHRGSNLTRSLSSKELSLSCVIVSQALHAAPRYVSHQRKSLIFLFHIWPGVESNAAFLKKT